ncbi:MAG: hypothetical protein ACI9EX_001286 [Oleispira sp.]|jgi:hypothetical protein
MSVVQPNNQTRIANNQVSSFIKRSDYFKPAAFINIEVRNFTLLLAVSSRGYAL